MGQYRKLDATAHGVNVDAGVANANAIDVPIPVDLVAVDPRALTKCMGTQGADVYRAACARSASSYK